MFLFQYNSFEILPLQRKLTQTPPLEQSELYLQPVNVNKRNIKMHFLCDIKAFFH